MAIVTVTSSTAALFTDSEIKTWLRSDTDATADNTLIDSLIDTAITRYQEYTGRVPLKTTFSQVDACFPRGALVVRRYPLVSISSIKGYTDTDDTDAGGVAMSSSGYYIDTASRPGRVVPLGGTVYPTATRSGNAAIVQFIAGESSAGATVSADVKTTIAAMVTRAYEHRGDEAAMEHAMLSAVAAESNTAPEWG